MTVIDAVFPSQQHIQQVIENPAIKLNFTVARARALARGQSKAAQLAGLTLTAAANLAHRRWLGHFFERVLFHVPGQAQAFADLPDLPTRWVSLDQHNLKQALQASGSIPMVLDPVRDIPGAGLGVFYDGGITDYHFDVPFSQQGLVLYPHFYPQVSPGWFDKSLPWRRRFSAHYDRVVMLCPSSEWIRTLPGGKIPDRNDFKRPDHQRLRDWAIVIERSHELAEAFQRGDFRLERLY